MANRQETIIIDVQVADVKKQLGDTAKAINDLKEQNKALKKEQKDGTADWAESTATIKANEAQIKLLTAAEKSLEGQLRAATAENKKYGDSNVELRAQVADLERQYNALTDAQKNTAAGKALLQQQNELKEAVKGNAEELGNFQDSVGNYEKATTPLSKTFNNLKNQSDAMSAGISGFISGIKGAESPLDLFKKGVDSTGLSMEALSKNPIILVLSILITLFNSVKDSISSSSKATNTLKEAMAPVNALMTVLKNSTVALLQVFLDAFLAVSKFTVGLASLVTGNDKYTKSVLDSIKVEQERQAIAKKNRELIVEEAKGNLEVAKLRDKVTEKDKYTRAQREQFLREAIAIERKMADEKIAIAKREYNNLVNQLKSKAELSSAEKQQLAEAKAKLYNVETDYYQSVRRMKTQVATFNKQEDEEEAARQQKAAEDAARRREERNRAEEKARADRLAKDQKAAEARKAAEQKAEEERLKAIKDQADKEIAILDQELELEKLRVQENNAGKKLSNEESHKQRLAEIDSETVNIIGKLNAQLRAGEITEKQFEDAKTLRRQEVRTQIAEENAAFEAQELENRRVAAATDLQNEMALAEMKNQSLYSLKLQQLEAERLAEIEAADKTGADTLLIEEKYTELKKQLSRAEIAAKLDMASGFAGNIAEIFGKSTKVGKAAASAQIAIDSAKGAFAAFTSMASIPFVGPVLGAAAAGAVVAKGVKSIKDVWAVKSGLPSDGGGGGATAPAAPTGTATTYTPATKGADLVLNSDQAGSLNGKISAAQPASGGIDYDLLAKSMSKQPAPVMVYSEFKSFEGKVTSFDEQTKI